MINLWDDRYSSEEYIYGTSPNEFFKLEVEKIPIGKILLPAEGEGRNAVFAATLGWDVTAFDSSLIGKNKAEKLATINKVSINYLLSDFDKFETEENSFDCISLIYSHIPESIRKKAHKNLIKYLKPGGILLLEGFSKNQINNNSGGPKKIEMLFSKEILLDDFSSLSKVTIYEEDIQLNEGQLHKGNASVVRLVGIK
jgi:SAM-dependent methyltransferase